MATEGFSMQRAKLIVSFPRQRGSGWGRCLRPRHPHPNLPPQLRGKEPDRLPIHVIAVEKLLIGRLSKCHSTLTAFFLHSSESARCQICRAGVFHAIKMSFRFSLGVSIAPRHARPSATRSHAQREIPRQRLHAQAARLPLRCSSRYPHESTRQYRD